MSHLPLTSIVTLLILLLVVATSINVGRARGKYGVKAPATTGDPMFERAYRVQMNTLEGVVPMLPALWMYATLIGDVGAACMGLVWVAGRVWYAVAYMGDPARRSGGWTLAFIAFAGMWLGALWGAVRLIGG